MPPALSFHGGSKRLLPFSRLALSCCDLPLGTPYICIPVSTIRTPLRGIYLNARSVKWCAPVSLSYRCSFTIVTQKSPGSSVFNDIGKIYFYWLHSLRRTTITDYTNRFRGRWTSLDVSTSLSINLCSYRTSQRTSGCHTTQVVLPMFCF